MKPLQPKLVYAYDDLLARKGIAGSLCAHYKKWLRFYLFTPFYRESID